MIPHLCPNMKWPGFLMTIFFLCLSRLIITNASASEFNLDKITKAIVHLEIKIKPEARTAETLGLERNGNGVVIGSNGLILTIGYLIMESSSIHVTAYNGRHSVADFIAYDHRTGFGLLRARKKLGLSSLKLGDSATLKIGAPMVILSAGKTGSISPVRVSSRRSFAGYWEYLVDNAIFTMPPHHRYGGAALVDLNGYLMGIGSLFVGDAQGPESQAPGNMFVPIDLAKPILRQMINTGRSGYKPRPWLGVYVSASKGRVYINEIAARGPSEEAGLKRGDIIVGVSGRRVSGLADLFRKIWSRGDAGAKIELNVIPVGSKDLKIRRVFIHSKDRRQWLRIDENK